MTANGMFFVGEWADEENVLKLVVVMVAKLRFTKTIELCNLNR